MIKLLVLLLCPMLSLGQISVDLGAGTDNVSVLTNISATYRSDLGITTEGVLVTVPTRAIKRADLVWGIKEGYSYKNLTAYLGILNSYLRGWGFGYFLKGAVPLNDKGEVFVELSYQIDRWVVLGGFRVNINTKNN